MRKLFIILALILFLPLVASLDTYEVSTNISLNHPVRLNNAPIDSAACNITVLNPTPSTVVDYLAMTPSTTTYNYTIIDSLTSTVGTYNYYITCIDDAGNSTFSDQFEVTYTGKDNAGTGFIVVFSLIFILMSASLLYLFLHSVVEGGRLEYDLTNLSFSWGFLFGLMAMYLIFNSYWGDLAIGGILLWVLKISVITNGFVPIVLFIISLMFGSLRQRSMVNMFQIGGRRR